MGQDAEARRQQALLAALHGAEPDPAGDAMLRMPQGLAAYRANARAIAERALAAACPTLQAMLGDEDFARLAAEHWHAHPPVRGDLGAWGDALPGWIAAHPGLVEWPWLADTARLDLAVHHAERAADAVFDADSLALLTSEDPAALRLLLQPGTALIVSDWPVVLIHAAHAAGPEHRGTAFVTVREALAAGLGERALVVREGWRAAVHAHDAAAAAFVQAVLAGATLGAALDAAGEGFDFAGWLAQAIGSGWLKGFERAGD